MSSSGVDEFEPLVSAAVLVGPFAAGVFDQDAPHGLSGGGEEVAAIGPVEVLALGPEQAQVGLMHQGRGLKCLARIFLSQPQGRQAAQLVVDQRQQLFGGLRVAGFDSREVLRDVVHGPNVRRIRI